MADIQLPIDIEVKTQKPLISKRGPVQTKADLINPNSWSHDGDTFYVHDGMLVPVLSSGDIWMLIDKTLILDDRYRGWKLMGSGGGSNIDGGRADEIYSPDQYLDCGGATAGE